MGFILKNAKADKSLIVLSYNKVPGNTPFRYSTGETIITKYWNKDFQRATVIGVTGMEKTQNILINQQLERYEKCLAKVLNTYALNSDPLTKEALMYEFDKEFKLEKNKGTTDFYIIFQWFIDQSESGERTTKKGTVIGKQRLKKYQTVLNNLKEFRPVLDVYDIDMSFFSKFIHHRNKNEKALNTIALDIAVLKTVLKTSFKAGVHTNSIFENEDFKLSEEDVENIFLNDEELDILWNLELPNDRLKKTRDLFLIGCYTGLRISDLSQLTKVNIQGNLLKVITEKTDEIVFIPIHWKVFEILEIYDGIPPKAFSDQKMNEYIKELCKLAEFNQKAQFKQTRGGKVIREVKEKWERVTNHTARRSFATNLYLAGFDSISIMKITGHRSEKSFMKYICVTQRQMAEKMLSHPYFKK